MKQERLDELIFMVQNGEKLDEAQKAEVSDALKKGLELQTLPEPKYFGVGRCPRCGIVFIDDSTAYCGNCGQKIRFEERTDGMSEQTEEIEKELGRQRHRVVPQGPLLETLRSPVTLGGVTFCSGTRVIGHCPACGSWVKPTMKFCAQCAQALDWTKKEELPEDWRPYGWVKKTGCTPDGGARPSFFCPHCGREVPVPEHYCPDCGIRMDVKA